MPKYANPRRSQPDLDRPRQKAQLGDHTHCDAGKPLGSAEDLIDDNSHRRRKAAQIAETVLMPGDPYRAKWAAETFLDGAELVNDVRGMLGFTGTWRGNPVTIQGSGMGMPSLSIYANELIRDYGAKTLIRIGSCGACRTMSSIRDVDRRDDGQLASPHPRSGIFRELNFAPCADWSLLRAAVCRGRGARDLTSCRRNLFGRRLLRRTSGPERADDPARDPRRRDGGGRTLQPRRAPRRARAGGPDRVATTC